MSPEQVSSQPADARSDLYSLGLTFYQMVTGRRAIQGESEYVLLAAQMMQIPPAPSTVNPAIPAILSTVIMKAVEKDPAARFQTAESFRAALRGQADVTPPKGSAFPVPGAGTVGVNPPPALLFDAELLQRIEASLASAVGPIARQLVLRSARRSADLTELCRTLSEQIPGPAERQAFLRAWDSKPGTTPAVSAVRTPVPGQAQGPGPGLTLDPALLQAAKEKLSPYIGPIAGMLVNRTARKARSREEFFDALAAEIPSESDRIKFLSSIR
jgi:serine/threonine-protein kinase